MPRTRHALARTTVCALAVLCGCQERNQPPQANGAAEAAPVVQAELIADVKAAAPGASFNLGVLLHVPEGWHVYWKYPGDAGLPTTVQFHLPEGFQAGPLRYPAPSRFEQPGGITGFGYAGPVLLWAEIQGPREPVAKSVTVEAEVSYLACRERCVAGSAKSKLTLPVRPKAEGDNREVFDRWRASLPVDADQADGFRATVQGRIRLPQRRGRFQIVLEGPPVLQNAEWVYAGMDQIVIKDVRVSSRPQRVDVAFTAELLPRGALPHEMLETLIVYPGPSAIRRAIRVPVPLRPQQTESPAANP